MCYENTGFFTIDPVDYMSNSHRYDIKTKVRLLSSGELGTIEHFTYGYDGLPSYTVQTGYGEVHDLYECDFIIIKDNNNATRFGR